MTVRAITLHQPWATLIALGVKTIETRSWLPSPKLFDPGLTLLIHAGQKLDVEACHYEPAIAAALKAGGVGRPADLPTGAVVAVGNVYRADRHPGGLASATAAEQAPFGHFGPGRCYWMFSSTVDRLPSPVAARGRQGLWIPSDALLDEVRGQVPGSVWLRGETLELNAEAAS